MSDERTDLEVLLTRSLAVPVRAEVKASTRSSILATPRAPKARTWTKRLAVTLAAMLVLGGAAVPASANTLPGDALYPIKTATEKVRLAFARGPGADARLHAAFASERAEEMEQAFITGRPELIPGLAARYDQHLSEAIELSEVAGGTVFETVLDAVAKHTTVLTALLDRAPEQALPGLERAVEASSKGKARLEELFGDGKPGRPDERPGRPDEPGPPGGAPPGKP